MVNGVAGFSCKIAYNFWDAMLLSFPFNFGFILFLLALQKVFAPLDASLSEFTNLLFVQVLVRLDDRNVFLLLYWKS